MKSFKKWLVVTGLISFLALQPLSLLADGEENPPHGKPPGNGGGAGTGGGQPPVVGEDGSIHFEIWQDLMAVIKALDSQTKTSD